MQLKYNNYTHHDSQSTNKYQLSTEARKSSATSSHRHDVLPYINLLDKCTQILREDRIWIRNQLKANDTDIIAIFKETRKPVNLQHLQIRLRKYVTAFKSKAKMEQLMKFKQNMHLGDYKYEKATESKRQTSTSQNPHKYQLHQSSSLSRTTNMSKMGTSQNRSALENNNSSFDKTQNMESHFGKADKKSMIYPYRNSQNYEKDNNNFSKQKKTCNFSGSSMSNTQKNMNIDYPAPMEQITERDSENMTSARQRINDEVLFSHPNPNDGLRFGAPFSYTQWKRPDSSEDNQPADVVKDPLEQIRAQFSKVGIKNGQTFNHAEKMQAYKNNFLLDEKKFSNQKNSSEKESMERFSRNKNEIQQVSRQNSAREHESYDQPEFSSYHDPEPQRKEYPGTYKFDNFQRSNGVQYENHNESLHSYRSNNSEQKNISYQEKDQSEQTNLMQNAPLTYTIPSSEVKNNYKSGAGENIFTSPQLLAECRNFLKSKSNNKQGNSLLGKIDMEGSLKPLNLQFDDKYERTETPFSMSESISRGLTNSQNTFNNDLDSKAFKNINFYPQQSKKQSYTYKNEEKQNIFTNDNNRDNYEYFHTFAAQSSQKKGENNNIQINIKPETKMNLNFNIGQEEKKLYLDHQQKDRTFEKTNVVPHNQEPEYENYQESYNNLDPREAQEGDGQSATGQLFTPEFFVTFVLDLVTNEPQGFIYWRTLEKAINEQCPQLMDAARDYLYNEEGLVLISNIGRVMNDLLESPSIENDAKNIYKLLDIEQKGFIYQKDIDDFLCQLEQSEADDVETIGQLLWKLFEEIDSGLQEGQEKRVDYWGLYASHTSQTFEKLNQILKQFDFQIE